MDFISYVIVFALGGSFVLLFWKRAPAPLPKQKHEKELNQLQSNNDSLGIDKINLQSRNSDLVKIIAENQRSIKELRRNNKELKNDFKTVISHQMTILELLSSVTKIQDQKGIDSKIVITERFVKKYSPHSSFLDSSQNPKK